jgi:hypothetical protein
MVGFAAPIFLMLIFFFGAFRYRGEFYAFLDFAALIGFYTISQRDYAVSKREKLRRILIWSAVIGIVSSHVLLLAYKISPFAPPSQTVASGYLKSYYWLLDKWLHQPGDIP